MSDEVSWQLTPEQRARLRRTVSHAALERLLARLPAGARSLMFLGFCDDPTPAEALAALRDAHTGESELEEMRRFLEDTPLPPHLAHPENDPDPGWTAPALNMVFQVQPPDDPELRALWEAVEPRPRTA